MSSSVLDSVGGGGNNFPPSPPPPPPLCKHDSREELMGNSLLAATRWEGEGLEEEDTLSNAAHIPQAMAGSVTGGKKKEEES